MDQRVEKTYADLQKSMRALLGKSPWEDISVQHLCKHANVSRSTFYSHFKNKDDLLDSLLSQFEAAMRQVNNKRSIRESGTLKFLPIFLNHVSDNRKLFAKNNTSAHGYPVASRFRALLFRLVSSEIEEAHGRASAELASYVAGGIYSAVVLWCTDASDSLPLKLLNSLDEINRGVLAKACN